MIRNNLVHHFRVALKIPARAAGVCSKALYGIAVVATLTVATAAVLGLTNVVRSAWFLSQFGLLWEGKSWTYWLLRDLVDWILVVGAKGVVVATLLWWIVLLRKHWIQRYQPPRFATVAAALTWLGLSAVDAVVFPHYYVLGDEISYVGYVIRFGLFVLGVATGLALILVAIFAPSSTLQQGTNVEST